RTGLAFVTGGSVIYVIDLKDPMRPKLINTVPIAGGYTSGLVEKDGWVYAADRVGGMRAVDFDPALLTLVCYDPAFPNVKLGCDDYYPALGEKRIAIEGHWSIASALKGKNLKFVSAVPNTVLVTSKAADTRAAAFDDKTQAVFYVDSGRSYSGEGILLRFELDPPSAQVKPVYLTLRARNNSNVTLKEVLDGTAVFTYDPIINNENHAGRTTGGANDLCEVDFAQKMLNHVIVPLRTPVSDANIRNTIGVDGYYGERTLNALWAIMAGGVDPVSGAQSITRTNVSHHIDEKGGPNTLKKLASDYSGLGNNATVGTESLNTNDEYKVIDKEILVGLAQSVNDTHPTRLDAATGKSDIGLYELYQSDDWDSDGLSNYVEVENGMDPLVADAVSNLGVPGGTRSNGTLTNGLRIANVNKGYYYFAGPVGDNNNDNYGALTALTIIESVAREWERLHPDLDALRVDNFVANASGAGGQGAEAPRIGIGDLSRRGGGYFSPHHEHQNGLDADVRYVRSDNAEAGLDLSVERQRRNYSQDLTLELLNLLLLYNDAITVIVDPRANAIGTTRITVDVYRPATRTRRAHLPQHYNHIHVKFPQP
ncbi:MAG: penicillin-insensitive murein endopeptidase, partial [Deltaproteobacteria bacterium]|nr:penicillin-insensitive murein endopeptidase [Deltaproteobacteria bacterium]